jgi:hypothetical protein
MRALLPPVTIADDQVLCDLRMALRQGSPQTCPFVVELVHRERARDRTHGDEKFACEKIGIEVTERRLETQFLGGNATVRFILFQIHN